MKNTGPNTKSWSRNHPGLIIFLIDQSYSMSEKYIPGKNKAEFVCDTINETINDIVFSCTYGNLVKDYCFISLIGYGGSSDLSIDDIRSDYISEFADNPMGHETKMEKTETADGNSIELPTKYAVHLDAVAHGLTPMADAFAFAKGLIEAWMAKKPDNPAPVIINISDGMPVTNQDDRDDIQEAIDIAEEIKQMQTTDGHPVILNAHLSNTGVETIFEVNRDNLLDQHAQFLFDLSSIVPESFKKNAKKHNLPFTPNCRGFVSNAKSETFIKFIEFGSTK